MSNLHDALSGDYIFCCKHCEGPLELTDKQPCYETYKCESCGRTEILECDLPEDYRESPECEDGFPITCWNGLYMAKPENEELL